MLINCSFHLWVTVCARDDMRSSVCLALIGVGSAVAYAPQPALRAGSLTRAARPSIPLLAADSADAEGNTKADDSSLLDALPIVASVGTLGCALIHEPAFSNFYQQWQDISASGVTGDAFWAPLQFWLFFASMHPLLQPALWISEVLHGSPGPQVADLIPVVFLVGNIVTLGALATLPKLQTAVNVALLGLFINYVGSGIEGTNGLGDYNLALDDGVKGCPTYEEVRQPSMVDFDKTKYTGRWYEHAFHDYTQFSDTYDVTLDIELSADKVRP